uniref:Secreted protein n=1 Tax=Anguilla anguilla TaxID=7936 RepID=A0A0E9XF75_ANGAN
MGRVFFLFCLLLRLFEVLLFIHLCQTQFALLVVQGQPLLVLEHLLFRLLLAHHVVPCLVPDSLFDNIFQC